MQPTDEQNFALETIRKWFYNSPDQVFKLGGLAGTGKSSMIAWIHEFLDLDTSQIQYVAPTNKAALIVQRRLRDFGIRANARTIHKAYYTKSERHCNECPLTESLRNVCHGVSGFNACGCHLDFNATMQQSGRIKLVICDESSMVSREIFEDVMLTCRQGVKVLFIGDHGQLEAVDDNKEITKRFGKFFLMNNPDFILKEIQRQAKDSPIIHLAYQARQGYEIDYDDYGSGVQKVKMSDELEFDVTNPQLVGITYFANVDPTNQYHKDRISVSKLNRLWRMNLALDSELPVIGDRVITREHMRRIGLAKGSLGTIREIEYKDHESHYATIDLDDGRLYEGLISAKQFYDNKQIWGAHHLDKFDYGYALTCHTAQGSEFDSVVVFEPSKGFIKWLGRPSYSRWLYTAITRAKRQLLLVG